MRPLSLVASFSSLVLLMRSNPIESSICRLSFSLNLLDLDLMASDKKVISVVSLTGQPGVKSACFAL